MLIIQTLLLIQLFCDRLNENRMAGIDTVNNLCYSANMFHIETSEYTCTK